MAVTLPLRSDLPHFDVQVTLDELTYTLEFRWNGRDSAWYMDVRDENGEPIQNGVKVVVDMPLGKRTRNQDFPKGYFFAVDSSGEQLDPGLEDLGDRVQIYYFEESDLE